MKSIFLALASLCVLAGPALAQETILERLNRLEQGQQALAKQVATNQVEIVKGLADVKAAVTAANPVPNVTCPVPTGSLPLGPSFSSPACSSCTSSAGSYPSSSCGSSDASPSTSCGGGLFARLRERRAARRGY